MLNEKRFAKAKPLARYVKRITPQSEDVDVGTVGRILEEMIADERLPWPIVSTSLMTTSIVSSVDALSRHDAVEPSAVTVRMHADYGSTGAGVRAG